MGNCLISRPKNFSLELLWENSNPNSSFNDQTISVNTSGVDWMMFISKGHFREDFQYKSINLISKKLNSHSILVSGYGSTICVRAVDISDTTIHFSNGAYWQGNTSSTNDSQMGIPVAVYKINW